MGVAWNLFVISELPNLTKHISCCRLNTLKVTTKDSAVDILRLNTVSTMHCEYHWKNYLLWFLSSAFALWNFFFDFQNFYIWFLKCFYFVLISKIRPFKFWYDFFIFKILEHRPFKGITWESLPRGCQSLRLDYQIGERAYRAFCIVLFQFFEWTTGRTSLVSSLTCSSRMLLSGEITNPLVVGFEAKALPDKTLD